MLKLVWTLRSGLSRYGPRTSSRSIPNHEIISACSSVATATQVKNDDATKHKEAASSNSAKTKKHRIVNLVFDSLSEVENPGEVNSSQIIMVHNLLRFVDDNVSPERARDTLDTLRKWVETRKVEFKHFENNDKYLKLCRIARLKSNQLPGLHSASTPKLLSTKASAEPFPYLDESSKNLRTFPVTQAIETLSTLAVKQQRNKTLLSTISANIANSNTTLSVKNIADILYGVAILNFPDEVLLKKLCKNLLRSLSPVSHSSIIGSIATSLGMMRYRDTQLLNAISEWIVSHKDILRTQDLCALIMTLAVVGYNPSNSKVLFQELMSSMKETEMVKSSEWLNVVWSLTILGEVSPQQLESVLNSKFLNKLLDPNEPVGTKIQKLLNINAAAKLLKDYSGPVLTVGSDIIDEPAMRPKHKQEFVKSITDALADLFPSRDYFHTNVLTGTGFLIDIEFSLDKKCTPLSLEKVKSHTNPIKVAIVANNYYDYCLGENTVLGPVKLHDQLLQARGYRILQISHTDYHMTDKLLTRITYLNDRIKSIVK